MENDSCLIIRKPFLAKPKKNSDKAKYIHAFQIAKYIHAFQIGIQIELIHSQFLFSLVVRIVHHSKPNIITQFLNWSNQLFNYLVYKYNCI